MGERANEQKPKGPCLLAETKTLARFFVAFLIWWIFYNESNFLLLFLLFCGFFVPRNRVFKAI
jgi:hypothetical protein